MLKEALFPFGLAYQGATGMRNLMFNWGLRKVRKVDTQVVSIGNLTVGGTGKTPMTLATIEMLKKRRLSVGVVSRGYKRGQKGVLHVDTSPRAALNFGDEPTLIKSLHPDVPVVVGESRVEAARALLTNQEVDVIVCDDAFQHRSIHRDLNILLMDVTEPINNYRVLPVGRAREAIGPAMARADFVIMTKANLVPADDFDFFKSWLEPQCKSPLLRADYTLLGFHSLNGQKQEELVDAVMLVSGIAKPQTLEQMLQGRARILKHKSFPDHNRYTDLDVEILLDEASQMRARWILTTAKDAMKLGSFPRLKERLWVAELGLKFSGDTKEFNEALDRLARPSRK